MRLIRDFNLRLRQSYLVHTCKKYTTSFLYQSFPYATPIIPIDTITNGLRLSQRVAAPNPTTRCSRAVIKPCDFEGRGWKPSVTPVVNPAVNISFPLQGYFIYSELMTTSRPSLAGRSTSILQLVNFFRDSSHCSSTFELVLYK